MAGAHQEHHGGEVRDGAAVRTASIVSNPLRPIATSRPLVATVAPRRADRARLAPRISRNHEEWAMKMHSVRLAADFLALGFPLVAPAASDEIPITTSSAEARLAFDAGQAAIDRGDAQ